VQRIQLQASEAGGYHTQIISKVLSDHPSLEELSHGAKLLLKELNHLLHIAAVLGCTVCDWETQETLKFETNCVRNREMAVEVIVHATGRQDRAILSPLVLQNPMVLISRLVTPKPHVVNAATQHISDPDALLARADGFFHFLHIERHALVHAQTKPFSNGVLRCYLTRIPVHWKPTKQCPYPRENRHQAHTDWVAAQQLVSRHQLHHPRSIRLLFASSRGEYERKFATHAKLQLLHCCCCRPNPLQKVERSFCVLQKGRPVDAHHAHCPRHL
jgi:hypothetical protein